MTTLISFIENCIFHGSWQSSNSSSEAWRLPEQFPGIESCTVQIFGIENERLWVILCKGIQKKSCLGRYLRVKFEQIYYIKLLNSDYQRKLANSRYEMIFQAFVKLSRRKQERKPSRKILFYFNLNLENFVCTSVNHVIFQIYTLNIIIINYLHIAMFLLWIIELAPA